MSLAPADMLCFSLYGAQQAMQAAYKPLLDPLGLTYPQYLVLSALWIGDGQSVGALGTTLGLDTNTLTPLLKRMQAAGLVDRRRDAVDERSVRVTLTERGRALEAQAETVRRGFLKATGLSPDQAAALRDRIADLRATLTASTTAPRC